MLRFLLRNTLVCIGFLSQTALAGVAVTSWSMTQATPSANVCATPTSNTTFWTTDPQAALWFAVTGANAGDQATAQWYSPDGDLYTTYHFGKVPTAGNYCFSGWIGIAGESAASLPGTWTVKLYWNGTLEFTDPFTDTAVSLSFGGSLPPIASGGGWDTTVTLLNLSSSSAQASLQFFGDSGSQLSLPFTFPQQPSNLVAVTPVMDETIAANALRLVDTSGGTPLAPGVGWGELLSGGNVDGFAIFRYIPTGQEATVPLETRNAGSYILAFDNTGSLATGVAIANTSSEPATIPVTISDDTGTQIGTDSLDLPAQGHTSFMLADNYGFTAGRRGTVLFTTPSGRRISVLGIRANGAALTTLPALSYADMPSGTLAQVASGGGWQTTFTLVNTGLAPVKAQLSFFDNNGNPLSLPMVLPQSGKSSTAASLTETIAAGATLLIVTSGSNGETALTGSAVLTAQGNLDGFAIFRYNPSGQEAVVPLASQSAGSYFLAFDNTDGLGTGLALANASSQAAAIPVILRDDTGASLGTFSINLPAQGHTSFMLTANYPATAGKRGTVELETPTGGSISAVGLRATPTGVLTTIPVFTGVTAAGGSAER